MWVMSSPCFVLSSSSASLSIPHCVSAQKSHGSQGWALVSLGESRRTCGNSQIVANAFMWSSTSGISSLPTAYVPWMTTTRRNSRALWDKLKVQGQSASLTASLCVFSAPRSDGLHSLPHLPLQKDFGSCYSRVGVDAIVWKSASSIHSLYDSFDGLKGPCQCSSLKSLPSVSDTRNPSWSPGYRSPQKSFSGFGRKFPSNNLSLPWEASTRRGRHSQRFYGRFMVICRAERSSVEQFGAADHWGTSAEQERLLKWLQRVPLSNTLKKVVPFIGFQVPIILKGWLCCCVSVGCLYMLIPQIGMLSKHLSQGDLPEMGWRTALVVSLVGARSIALFWQQALLWEAVLNVTFKVRSYVFEKVLKREMAFFEGQQAAAAGDIAFRINTEAEDLGDTVYSLLHTMVPSALQLIAMSTRMITLNRLLSAATFLVVPCMAVVIALLGERLRKLARKSQDSIAKLSSYLTEILPSMFVVKAHAAEVSEQFRFQTLAWTENRTHLDKKKMKAFIPEMITLVYLLTALVLLSLGTWAISKGTFDGAGMVSFITSLVLLVEPLQAIGRAYNEIKLGEPAIERLFEVTTSGPIVLEKHGALPLQTASGEVELMSVSFRYNEYSPWVLNNVSLFVHPGETVALVGASGGGKTTLAKLLLRLYDPVHGTIFIDGKDIRDLSLKSLRKHVAIVPQETTLFTGTVVENIAYGKLPFEVNIQAVMRAAQLANADEFIQKLKHGYATNLGDRASSLSGGQKQRLAIARAIYQEATVLILDEATSALDNKSEKLVQAALERLMYQKTVFVIAHRLETVKRADRILVLDEGRIVEEGTHLSLLGSGGKYAALNMTQDLMVMPEALA